MPFIDHQSMPSSQHVDFSEEVWPVGVELFSDTATGRPSEAEHYAEWVRFNILARRKAIDVDYIGEREGLMRGHLNRTEKSERALEAAFTRMFASALAAMEKQAAQLERRGHQNFRVLIGLIGDQARPERDIRAGASALLPFGEFRDAVANDMDRLVTIAKESFHIQNDDLLRDGIQKLEERKLSGEFKPWNAGRQPDGTPFGFAFSKTDRAAVLMVTRATRNAFPNWGIAYTVGPRLDALSIGARCLDGTTGAYDARVAAEAVKADRAQGAALDGLPVRVVEAECGVLNCRLFEIGADGVRRALSAAKAEALIANMVGSAKDLDLTSLRPAASAPEAGPAPRR